MRNHAARVQRSCLYIDTLLFCVSSGRIVSKLDSNTSNTSDTKVSGIAHFLCNQCYGPHMLGASYELSQSSQANTADIDSPLQNPNNCNMLSLKS